MNQPFDPPLPTLPRDRYQVLNLLGEGGMGRVYRARDRHLNRFVALKFLRREDPTMARRLALEAQFQAGLDHPAILRVYEVGLLEDAPCIALQYVDGPDLQTLAPRLPLHERVALVAQAARGIHAAHQQGLIHRDLKPQNILVEEATGGLRQALVMDFGLARPVQDSDLSLSHSLVGSPFYLPPEQITGSGLDARSDVYSLGATLYAVVTGRPPFDARGEAALLPQAPPSPGEDLEASGSIEAPAVVETLRRVLDEDPVPPRRLQPDLPRDLETVILKCLEKDPARRYESAKSLAEDLERFLHGDPILARRGSCWYRTAKVVRRNRAIFLVGGLAALTLLGVQAWNLAQADRARQASGHAQRFSAQGEQMAQLLRLSHMSPLHDRRPQVAWIRAQMASIEAESRRLGRLAEGPAAYALGQAHLVLDEAEAALTQLERAWQRGFRTPAAAAALAETHLMLLYQGGLKANAIPDPSLREARRSELTRRHREPALAYLRQAQEYPGMHDYREVELAFLEQREDDVLRHAEASLAASPWMYEVLSLAADVWETRASREASPEGRRSHLQRSLDTLTRAVDLAPSDPTMRVFQANILGQMAQESSAGPERTALIEKGLGACDTALTADPSFDLARTQKATLLLGTAQGDPQTETREARLQAAEALLAELLGRQPDHLPALHLKLMATQIRLDAAFALGSGQEALVTAVRTTAQRILALDPRHPGVHGDLADLHIAEGYLLARAGQDPRPTFREAVRFAETASRLVQPTPAFEELLSESHLQLGIAALNRAPYAEGAGPIHQGLELAARCMTRTRELPRRLEASVFACWSLQEHAFSGGDDGEEAYRIATAFLDKLLARWPDHGHALLERGRADVLLARWRLFHNGDPIPDLARARDRLQKAARHLPPQLYPHGSLCHASLIEAIAQARRGRPNGAAIRSGLEASRLALALNPDHHWAMAYRGALLCLRGRKDDAREGARLMRAAIARQPHMRTEFAHLLPSE